MDQMREIIRTQAEEEKTTMHELVREAMVASGLPVSASHVNTR